jgi:hypothetical protein
MQIRTLLRYLIGDRDAILHIAANRHALWLGLLFVLSAAFAREYDQEDLLREPWYLIIPLAASLASSFLLITVAYGIAICKGQPGRLFFRCYFSFLGLFWLTAPLAWLYAIPYERFLSPVGAMQANLATLGLVSIWRVALMIRVLVVLLDYSPWQAIFLVLLFADGLALTLLNFLPVPLIDIMGGLRLSPSQEVLRDVACIVCQVLVLSLPVWIVGGIVAARRSRPSWQASLGTPSGAIPPTGGLVLLALTAVLGWAAVLPFTQAEQQQRTRVERAFNEGRYRDALAEMSAHSPSDFPPHWDPPPVLVNAMIPDELLNMLQELLAVNPPEWVRQRYLEKLFRLLQYRTSLRDEEARKLTPLLRWILETPTLREELEREGKKDILERLKRAIRDRGAQGPFRLGWNSLDDSPRFA